MQDSSLEVRLQAGQTLPLNNDAKTQEQLLNELDTLRQQVIDLQAQMADATPAYLERVTDGFFVVDRHWRLVYLNSYAESVIRRSRCDVLGKSLWDEYPALVGTLIAQKYHEALETGKAVHFEAFDRAFERWWEIHAYPDATGLSVFFRDINDRKQAEIQQQSLLTELTEWQSRYEVVGQVSSQILYEWDIHLGRATWGANTEQILGYTRAEMPANVPSWLELVHPADRTAMQRIVEQAIRDCVPFHAEYRLRHKDGHYIWVIEKCQFVFNDAGDCNRAVGFIADISDRKQAEQTLRENAEIFRQITENIQEVFFICAIDYSQVLYISPAYEQIWGRSCESLYCNPTSWLDAIHPEDRNRIVAALERQPLGESFHQEYRIIRPDGSIRWIADRSALIRNQDGQFYRVTGIAEDITERRHAETALRQAVEFNQQIVTSLQEGVIVYSRDFQYLLWNRAMEQMSGLRAEAVLGKRPLEVFPFLEETGIHALLRRALAGETVIASDTYFQIPDTGRSGWTAAKFSPLRDIQGSTIGVIAIVHDITHRKQIELALEHRIQFERLLSQLSMQFINLKLAEIDQAVQQGLQTVGEFAGVDWVWVYLYSEDGRVARKAYEWVAEGIVSPLAQVETVSIDAFSWSVQKMRQSQPVYVYDLAELPPEAEAERSSAEAIGTKSFLAVPLTYQGNLIGSMGFHTFRSPKPCPAEDIALFSTLGTLFASTILRKRNPDNSCAVMRAIPDLLMRFNREGIYLELINPGNIDLFRPMKDCMGASLYDVLPYPLAVQRMYFLQRAFETGELQVYDYQFELGGKTCYEEARIVVSSENEALVIVRDVTDRKRAEIALKLQAERERLITRVTQNIHRSLDLEQVLDTTAVEIHQLLQADRVLFCRIDADGNGIVITESVSQGWVSLMGQTLLQSCLSGDHCLRNRVTSVADVACAEASDCCVELFTQFQVKAYLMLPILQSNQIWGLMMVQQCSASRLWQQTEIDLLEQLSNQVAIAIQQSELYQQLQLANQELHRLADQDGLTQVANRRRFDEYLDLQWHQLKRDQFPLTLLLCDVDHFKHYNDRYGHQAGDSCLQQVAQAIQRSTKRSTDLVARYGGEEFAVILVNTDAEGAVHIAQAIQAEIAHLCIPHSASLVSSFVTLSIGIASTVPTQTTSLQGLIAAADQALYQSKSRGRNRYCVQVL